MPQMRGDVAPRVGIVEPAVAGELVGLLAVLAAALAVALPGDGAEAAERPSRQPRRESDVQIGERVGDAARLLFGTARGEDHRARRLAQQMRRFDDGAFGNAGDLLDPFRPVAHRDAARLFEVLGPLARCIRDRPACR